MKKQLIAMLSIFLFIGIIQNSNAQKVIKTDDAVYTIDGEYYFVVTKKDIKTQKVLFKAETKIPDKSQKEMFYPGSNFAKFDLIGDNIIIAYSIWHKEKSSKDFLIKKLNTKTGKFSEPQLLYSEKLNSIYSSHEIVYSPVYSPDKSKLAILKDNISPSYNIDPELSIYETKSFSIVSTKKIDAKYENQKRVIEPNFKIDNNGDISLVFSLLNEKTKITTKTYTAEIPFNQTELNNIKEVVGPSADDGVVNLKSHGHFYKSLQDYLDNKPIPNFRIQSGSYSWTTFTGTRYILVDDEGNLKKEDAKDLPSDLFTYRSSEFVNSMLLIRVIDKKPYIVLAAGKLCYYSLYLEQGSRFYAEGWDGELMKFKENDFEDYLAKYNLLEDYKKDKPKREAKDDVNGYFNKIVNWQIKYFNLLNEKM